MAKVARGLFSWQDVEACSDLQRFILVLENLPDDVLIRKLEKRRDRGRDDYPVRAMFNALLAGVVFQHPSISSLTRELRRNPALVQACGFKILPVQKKPCSALLRDPLSGRTRVVSQATQAPRYLIPDDDNFSRFLANLIELERDEGLVQTMLSELRRRLMAELPGFGKHLGYDGKAIESHSTGQSSRKSGRTSDPEANWGKHETKGIDKKTGKAWSTTKTWFGYSLHLIADTTHEIPVAFQITPASHSEPKALEEMIATLFEKESPELAERCADFCADRGLDSGRIKARLWDKHRIRPLIDTRALWRDEKREPGHDPAQPITRALDPQRADTIVHTEKGTLHCVCPASGQLRDLAFQGFEAGRDTLKYRCPAAAYGFRCAGREDCHRAGQVEPGDYGRIVRVKISERDRRIFVPTPHGSPSWKRGYNKRSSLERLNNRLDHSFGFEHHFIRGLAKMRTRMGLALVVMMAMALGHIRAGREQQMRSLVRPVPAAA